MLISIDNRTSGRTSLVSTEQIRTDVELRLRQAGIGVMPDAAIAQAVPIVNIKVYETKSPDDDDPLAFAINIEVAVEQPAVTVRAILPSDFLDRSRTKPLDVTLDSVLHQVINDSTIVPTWRASTTLFVGANRVKDVRGYITDQVDKFINAWLAANPINRK